MTSPFKKILLGNSELDRSGMDMVRKSTTNFTPIDLRLSNTNLTGSNQNTHNTQANTSDLPNTSISSNRTLDSKTINLIGKKPIPMVHKDNAQLKQLLLNQKKENENTLIPHAHPYSNQTINQSSFKKENVENVVNVEHLHADHNQHLTPIKIDTVHTSNVPKGYSPEKSNLKSQVIYNNFCFI